MYKDFALVFRYDCAGRWGSSSLPDLAQSDTSSLQHKLHSLLADPLSQALTPKTNNAASKSDWGRNHPMLRDVIIPWLLRLVLDETEDRRPGVLTADSAERVPTPAALMYVLQGRLGDKGRANYKQMFNSIVNNFEGCLGRRHPRVLTRSINGFLSLSLPLPFCAMANLCPVTSLVNRPADDYPEDEVDDDYDVCVHFNARAGGFAVPVSIFRLSLTTEKNNPLASGTYFVHYSPAMRDHPNDFSEYIDLLTSPCILSPIRIPFKLKCTPVLLSFSTQVAVCPFLGCPSGTLMGLRRGLGGPRTFGDDESQSWQYYRSGLIWVANLSLGLFLDFCTGREKSKRIVCGIARNKLPFHARVISDFKSTSGPDLTVHPYNPPICEALDLEPGQTPGAKTQAHGFHVP
ncbi:hypothetical protein C8F04DRAFT_1315138 [Mycena alexandri]|uniref:Uncharacterized protein n=1 Tax=Mycena alexandri TaxID=1745969 RepID=A0AAD6T590_9AGAR|nr:hypothetical protein C8F04DRAFT_1315138 [Mycena alexandri]